MLISGGVIVVASFVILGYYGMRFVTSIQGEEKHVIAPNDSVVVQQYIARSEFQGAYIIAFSDFIGQPANVKVSGPDNQTIVEKQIGEPFVIETFPVEKDGNYTLTLSNPSANNTLSASVIIGDQESVVSSSINAPAAATTIAFSFVLLGGIGVLVAGAAITFMDWRRRNRMKMYGDTSDLV